MSRVALVLLACPVEGWLSPYRSPLHARPIIPTMSASSFLFGDPREAPIRGAVGAQLMKSSFSVASPEVYDSAVDIAFDTIDKLVPGGLNKLLEPDELERRRADLRKSVSERLATEIDSPLGDKL